MRVLLLGASGFLGRHVAAAARRDRGIELVAHAGRSSGGRNVAPMALDLLEADDAELRDFLRRAAPDAIVNAVGATGGDRERLEALNVRLVARLLAAQSEAAPEARFVQLGSAAEYGATPQGVPIDEESAARPVSDYGATKLAATELILAARDRATDAMVLRVFNPLGGGMAGDTLPGNAARLLRAALLAGDQEIRLGPLDDCRDFIDVHDVADAALLACLRPTQWPVLNVGSGEAVLTRDMVLRLAAVAGFEGRVSEDAAGSARSPRVPWQQADIQRAQHDLGWRPRHTLDEALAAVWKGI